MLKTKVYFLLICIVFTLTACSKSTEISDMLYTDALLVTNKSPYKTTEVTRGVFTKEVSCNAKLFYPITSDLTFQVDGATAIFKEYLVSKNEEVKKGAPVASFFIEYDTVALEEKEIKLQRAKDAYEESLQIKQEAITTAENNLTTISDGNEKEINRLNIKKLKLDYEKFKLTSEESLDIQTEELSQYKSDLAVTQLVAPMDGVISDLVSIKDGEIVQQDTILATMYSTEIMQLQVADSSGSLRYNMEVTIEYKNMGKATTVKGRVISASNILSSGLSDGVAYVELSEESDGILKANVINVKAETLHMDNVLLVDSKAVFYEEQAAYISILEGGSLHNRRFTVGGNNNEKYWILQGLEEGQTVVIQ